MAVTQQLARISHGQLVRLQESAQEVDRLCSFSAAPASDYYDLDWAGQALLRVFDLAGMGSEPLSTLRHGIDGGDELNADYRDHPHSIMVHPVTVIEPDIVAEIGKVLQDVDVAQTFAALPIDAEQARQAIGGSITQLLWHPAEYLGPHLGALREFYLGAAARGLAVVTWWD
ncbi:hypothetical protein ACFXHA_00395 [Nocardia sp. NPDC059240]|uniref:hypothetical protein n=1 Tax=Nocardia sp. NPDC059240 TaxID=3346786 RepID=UPI0036AAF97F